MSLRTSIAVLLGVFLSGASGTITFEGIYGFGGNNHAYCVDQTEDDGYILTFTANDSALEQVGNVLKTDSLGNRIWQRQYHSPNHCGGSFRGLCSTLDGGYVFAGGIGAQTVEDVWAVKTDSIGDTLWTYVRVGPYIDWFLSGASTPDSGCVLAGRMSEGSEHGMGLLKLSSDGEREWFRIFCPPYRSTSYGYVARATSDRGFYVNGTISGDTFGAIADDYIVRTDSIGETLWTVRYRPDIPGYQSAIHGSGCVTPDNGFVICGLALAGGMHWSYVARFDSTGANLWTRVLFDSTPRLDHLLKCVQATPDRGFVVVGSLTQGSTLGIILVRLDSLGNTLWTRVFDGADPVETDWGEWVINTRDGGFAASGIADYRPAYLIKTDSMGLVYNAVSERGPSPLTDDVLTAEPNPFQRVVNIRCGTALSGTPSLNVYDASGRMVRQLPSGLSATWDGKDADGRLVPAGTYFIEARTRTDRRLVKVLLTR